MVDAVPALHIRNHAKPAPAPTVNLGICHSSQTTLLRPSCTKWNLRACSAAYCSEDHVGAVSVPPIHCLGRSSRLSSALVSSSNIQQRAPTPECQVQAALHTMDSAWPRLCESHLQRTTPGLRPYPMSVPGSMLGVDPPAEPMLSQRDHNGLQTCRRACLHPGDLVAMAWGGALLPLGGSHKVGSVTAQGEHDLLAGEHTPLSLQGVARLISRLMGQALDLAHSPARTG